MHERLRRSILLPVIVALALMVPACAQQGMGPVTQTETGTGEGRTVAVGDVHGDFDQFVTVLREAGVIDKSNNWIAGKAQLVQTGDVLDRGPDSRKAMDLLMSLEQQAAQAGGAVHALIGNHEAMILADDWRYVHPGEEKAFGGADEYRKAMSAEGKYGKWIRSHDAVVKVGDVLFLHAGLRAAYARMSLAEINQAVRKELGEDSLGGVSTDPEGPLWDRMLSIGDEDEVADELDVVLKAFGVRHMVVGHTVSADGVMSRAGGRLIRIDVGMSAHYGGPAACLVIENGVFYEVRHPGVKRKLDVDVPQTSPAPEPAAAGRKAA